MLDINFIIQNKEALKICTQHKGLEFNFDEFIQIYEDKKELIQKINMLRQKKNQLAKLIKDLPQEEKQKHIESGKVLRQEIHFLEQQYRELQKRYDYYAYRVPNLYVEDTPIGKNDKDNEEVKKYGKIPRFEFNFKSALEIGHNLDIIDMSNGAKVSGPKNYFLKGDLFFLEQAIFQFVLNFLKKHNFQFYNVPILVKKSALYGTGYFPGSEDETYFLNKDDLFLIGTSEVSLCSYYRDTILDKKDLPIKMVSLSNCFRREAGTYGKSAQGLFRVHQFQKVEQVIFCENDVEKSLELHYHLLRNAESILQALELPYRVVRVCSGDLGFGQVMKHDIETWIPSKNAYAETHSCSSFYDFQARRLNIKYFNPETKKNEHPFSINNTAIASPRILIPILEIYQQEDGSILIPKVLRPYIGGKKYIKNESI